MEAVELSRILSGKSHAPIVYFIRIGDRVKIGTTMNLTERVKALSVTMQEVTHVMPGGPEVERAMHERWARYRVHKSREWFYVRGYLAQFLRPPIVRERKPRSARIRVPRPAVNAVPAQAGPPRFTLAAAAREGIVPMTADALRQAKRRDPGFPAGVDGKWTASELQRWHRNRRPSAGPAEASGE